MKNILELHESEKNRILNMHIYATKRQYLNEQQVIQGGTGDPYQYRKTGDKLEFAKKGTNTWQEPKTPKAITAINNLFLKQTNQQSKSPQDTATNTDTTQSQDTAKSTTNTDTTQSQDTTQTSNQPTQTNTQSQPAVNEQTLMDKIKKKCGPIWNDFELRVKGYETEMAGKTLPEQKDIARKMKKDENQTFKFCYKQYGGKSLLPTEKVDYDKLATGWSKFLKASWKVAAPVLTKVLTQTVDKAGELASKQVVKSLKGESYRHKKYTDKIINEIIRKNLRNL